jgi:hypothetical protein
MDSNYELFLMAKTFSCGRVICAKVAMPRECQNGSDSKASVYEGDILKYNFKTDLVNLTLQ